MDGLKTVIQLLPSGEGLLVSCWQEKHSFLSRSRIYGPSCLFKFIQTFWSSFHPKFSDLKQNSSIDLFRPMSSERVFKLIFYKCFSASLNKELRRTDSRVGFFF